MATQAPATEISPSGKVPAPPIYHLAGVGQFLDGDMSHDCWHARVVHETISAYSLPMVVKAVRLPLTLAVEVACGLAASELRLNVPKPGLVVADRADLPGISDETIGQRLLLVGSHYQRPDAFFAEAMANDPAAEKLVWDSVCSGLVGKQGAAWDELIANPDRHCENVLFDGTTWWLFDHDQALGTVSTFTQDEHAANNREAAIAHNARVNLLADQLMQRFAGQKAVLTEQIRRFNTGTKRVAALANYARQWKHPDAEIEALLKLIAVVLELIYMRLPALAEKLNARLRGAPGASALWT